MYPVLLAAMADNLEALQLLINHSDKLSYTDAQSPLYYATSNANIAMVRFCLIVAQMCIHRL